MFWGLGLWGYITSYKGISTNFVLREPSVYQIISDCLLFRLEDFSHLPVMPIYYQSVFQM